MKTRMIRLLLETSEDVSDESIVMRLRHGLDGLPGRCWVSVDHPPPHKTDLLWKMVEQNVDPYNPSVQAVVVPRIPGIPWPPGPDLKGGN